MPRVIARRFKNSRFEKSVFTLRKFFFFLTLVHIFWYALRQKQFSTLHNSERGGWGLLYFIVCHSGVIKRASWPLYHPEIHTDSCTFLFTLLLGVFIFNTFCILLFSGVIYDLSNSYQIAFYVAGACSTLATCLLFLVPVLMPKDTYNDGRGRAETVQYEGSASGEKPLLDGIRSPDSSVPTTSTKDSLGSCQKLNSNVHLSPSRSYRDRYWDLPKRASMRASMASLLSFSPLQPTREVLVIVEKVSQV